MKRFFFLIVVLFFWAVFVYADDDGPIVTDESTLFGGTDLESVQEEKEDTTTTGQDVSGDDAMFSGSILTDQTEAASGAGSADLLLKTEAVDIGGDISISTTTTADIDSLKENSTTFSLYSDLFLDARPKDDFRVFMKGVLSYPFAEGQTTDETTGQVVTRNFSDIFTIKELFSDFQIGDSLFFRAGKQEVTWGVGYFFSPADIINLSRIDPENPEADRTGPVACKVQFPFSTNNAYIYFLLDPFLSSQWPGIAPKVEFLIGNLETGLGGYYHVDSPPSGMITMTLPVSDVDCFAEITGQYGSDKTFIVKSEDKINYPLGFSLETDDTTFYLSATAGIHFSYSDEANNYNISFAGQYYYNSQGYKDPSVITDNKEVLGLFMASGDITVDDLLEPSISYGAASLGWNRLLDTDFSAAAFWMGNFSDFSGRINTTLSYSVNDHIRVSASLSRNYGSSGEEFTPDGPKTTLSFGTNLGSGKF